jgi:tetratricopeptide (TPR) repeat protein
MLQRLRSRPPQTLPDDIGNAGHRSLWRRALDLVFGYDFFISYSWSDGGRYAAALTRQLRSHGFEVFLDRDDYASGDDWKKVGAWKLRRTGQLVLVGSPAAVRSAPVIREVQIFSGTGRRIVPIDFDGTLEWKTQDTPLAQYLPAEILRIREPALALEAGPSELVVDTIRRTFNLVRQDKKRVNVLIGVAVVLAAIAAIAIFESVVATKAQHVAEEQRDKARRTLDQLTASAQARVMGFVERAETQAGRQKEINTITRSDAGGLPDLERAAQLLALSGRYFDNGDFATSLDAAQSAMSLLGPAGDSSHAERDPRRTLTDAHERIALAKAHLRRFEEARLEQAKGLALIQVLIDESPQDARLRERQAAALVNMGDICLAAMQVDDADRHFQQAVKLRSEVPDLQTSSEARRLLAATYTRMAGLKLARRQFDAAVEAGSPGIAMLEQLRTEKADDPVLRELSAAYDIRAKAVAAAGNPSLALTWRDKEFAVVNQLAAGAPDNIEWQHDLALSLDERGRVLEQLRKTEAAKKTPDEAVLKGYDDAALKAYDQAIAIGEALMTRNRIPADWPRDTARAHFHRGDLLKRMGQPTEALKAARHMAEILEKLASSSLDIVSGVSLENAYRLAREVLLASNRPDEALDTADQQLFAISLTDDRDPPDFQRLAQVLSSFCWTALFAQDVPRAKRAAQQAMALDPKFAGAQLNYAHALMFSGDLEEAKKAYLAGLAAGGGAAAKWRQDVRNDFKSLKARGLQHPLMAEIERAIGP